MIGFSVALVYERKKDGFGVSRFALLAAPFSWVVGRET